MNRKILLFYILSLVVGCTLKSDITLIDNLNGNTVAIFGHGGMGTNAILPTNTLASVQKALEIGADGTEIDIQMTKDGVFILFHDETLDNTTDKTGKINDLTWSEIEGGSYDNFFKAKENIITLSELLASIPNLQDYILTFDCKIFTPTTPEYRQVFIKNLIAIIEEYNIADNTFIELKHDDIIEELVAMKPNYKVFALGEFDHSFKLAKRLGLYGISVSDKEVEKEDVAEVHEQGIKVAFFTSNRKNNIIEKNPDYIQTDKLTHFLKLFGK